MVREEVGTDASRDLVGDLRSGMSGGAKNGLAAREIERKNDRTPKSAWFMTHRIREAMQREPLAGLLGGAVRLVACAATRLRPFTSEELAPDTVSAWQELRRTLETRRHQRTQRRRFRRDPATSLGKREAQLLQLSLPP